MKEIATVFYIGGHLIGVIFDDKKSLAVNMHPFIKESDNPLITQYLNKEKFKNFTFDKYGVYWDNDMSVSAEWCYQRARSTP
ncbi:MAG: DUF2442 domain-containing protein [Bacteroidales bacterium]|nr:DUF2442 domain-containing protein [Bacteroidales bacterium]MBR6279415.1 DUF2442 domain-containing protein [Bacteroidales bacterium]